MRPCTHTIKVPYPSVHHGPQVERTGTKICILTYTILDRSDDWYSHTMIHIHDTHTHTYNIDLYRRPMHEDREHT